MKFCLCYKLHNNSNVKNLYFVIWELRLFKSFSSPA